MKIDYKAYCLDLDGTVYRGTEPILAAVNFIGRLQRKGINPYYITNNSSSTQHEVQLKLESFGIETAPEFIMTSAIAAAQYCEEEYRGATIQVIGEEGIKQALRDQGFKIIDRHADVVMVGIDRQANYEKLAHACLAIRSGAKFIATNTDKAIPTERGLEPGNGSFVKLIEYSTGQKPIVIGKPEPYMLHFIKKSNGYKKEEMVMIGDNYETDILAGLRFGIDTIHVEGGVTTKEELLSKERQPTYSIQTLDDLKE